MKSFHKIPLFLKDGFPKPLYRYLTAPATSTAVDRLFSAAGLILDAKRSKMDPAWVDHILFFREAFLLGNWSGRKAPLVEKLSL